MLLSCIQYKIFLKLSNNAVLCMISIGVVFPLSLLLGGVALAPSPVLHVSHSSLVFNLPNCFFL